MKFGSERAKTSVQARRQIFEKTLCHFSTILQSFLTNMWRQLISTIFQMCLCCDAISIAVPQEENSHPWVPLMCQIQRKLEQKQLIIIKPNNNLIDSVGGFLGCVNTPHVIFDKDRVVQVPLVNAENESALIILPDVKIPRLLASLTLLPKTPEIRVWVVFTSKIKLSHVGSAFKTIWDMGYVNAVVLRYRLQEMYLYRYFPFSDKTCNQPITPVLSARLVPGMLVPEDIFRKYELMNFQGCTLRCGTFHYPPAVVVRSTGSKIIMDGIVSNIASVVSQALDFDCHFSSPSDGLNWGYIYINGTSYGLQKDVAKSTVDIGFADFLQSLERWQANDMIKAYRENCLTMLVHSGLGLPDRTIWAVLVDEFSFEMWTILYLTIAGSAVFAGFINRVSRAKSPLWSFTGSVVYVVLTFLGMPLRSRPESGSARIYFAAWFLFSMVNGMAYLASFSSLVAVPSRPTDIDTLDAAFKDNLTVYTYPTLLVFLADDDDQSLVAQIAKRAIPTKEPLRVLLAALATRKDHALLFPKMNIKFELAKMDPSEAAKLHVFKDFCVSRTMVSPMITRRGSPLTGALDNAVERVIESGLADYWIRAIPLNRRQEMEAVEPFSLRNVVSAFVGLAIGLLVSTIAFVLERIISTNNKRSFAKFKKQGTFYRLASLES